LKKFKLLGKIIMYIEKGGNLKWQEKNLIVQNHMLTLVQLDT
jgi:hypothetical protein